MMSDDDIISIIKSHRKDAFGPDSEELTADRAEAMNRYHGRPYGDEEEGYSQFVTKDLAENVDWAMPSIMRPFIQSGVLAEFRPTSKEDEEQVKVESGYINYLIMEENDGFLLLHDCIKDALILRNCYAKHYWCDDRVVVEKSWNNVSDLEIAMILQQFGEAEIEVIKADQQDDGTYNFSAKITTKESKIKILPVPPEELRVSNKCRGSLKDALFVEHIPRKTRSDLIAMGMDKEWVAGLAYKGQPNSTESVARDSVTDETDKGRVAIDEANQEMDYAEAYIRIDVDKDGIAELRKVITVNNLIPPGEEWNEVIDAIPFTGGVPKRMPHRHIGESFQDDLADLAEQHTTIVRQMFDNVYRTNHNQWAINERVDEGEFVDQGPSAIFRVEGREPVSGSIEPIRHEPIAQHLLPIISFIEEKKKKRTGVNEGDLDPDVLRQVTKGAFMADLDRKSQKIEMTTRMFAETFVKELVLNVHALAIKYQDQAQNVRLGGKYVDVRPSMWKPRNRVTVKVGLGTGSTDERMRKLTLLKSAQAEMMQMGLVSSEEAYALYVDFAKEIGEQNPEKYVMSPDANNPKYAKMMQERQNKGPEPNPLAEAEKVKGQFKIQSEQMRLQYEAQADAQKLRFDAALEQMKAQHKQAIDEIKASKEHEHSMMVLQADMAKSAAERQSKEAIEIFKGELQALLEGYKVDVGRPGLGAELGNQ